MRAGAELVWSDCICRGRYGRRTWLSFLRVSFDALEKVVVSSIEQFGDDRHVASAVAQPFAAT